MAKPSVMVSRQCHGSIAIRMIIIHRLSHLVAIPMSINPLSKGLLTARQ